MQVFIHVYQVTRLIIVQCMGAAIENKPDMMQSPLPDVDVEKLISREADYLLSKTLKCTSVSPGARSDTRGQHTEMYTRVTDMTLAYILQPSIDTSWN